MSNQCNIRDVLYVPISKGSVVRCYCGCVIMDAKETDLYFCLCFSHYDATPRSYKQVLYLPWWGMFPYCSQNVSYFCHG